MNYVGRSRMSFWVHIGPKQIYDVNIQYPTWTHWDTIPAASKSLKKGTVLRHIGVLITKCIWKRCDRDLEVCP